MTIVHGTWGDRSILFESDSCLVALLKLKSKERCSWHSHDTAYNKFYVFSGILAVKTEHGFTVLMPGESFLVPPGTYHEFQTPNTEATIIEVAYTKYDTGDIHRETAGGNL